MMDGIDNETRKGVEKSMEGCPPIVPLDAYAKTAAASACVRTWVSDFMRPGRWPSTERGGSIGQMTGRRQDSLDSAGVKPFSHSEKRLSHSDHLRLDIPAEFLHAATQSHRQSRSSTANKV